ncbi:unnamed protein product [Arabidopsis halleri]
MHGFNLNFYWYTCWITFYDQFTLFVVKCRLYPCLFDIRISTKLDEELTR